MVTSPLPVDDPILSWSAPQHLHVERGRIWYICAALAVIAMVIYSVITAAWTFTVLIALVTVAYWKVHKQAPDEKRLRIWEKGFAIEDEFYEWKKCKGYWILSGKNVSELHIEKQRGGDVKIQTGDVSPYLIQDTLGALLPELDDRKEHILDTIIRICKL